MSCPCVCTKVLDYCTVNVCDSIDFDVEAVLDGEHKLITDFLGVQLELTANFSIGDKIIFPINGLNENYQYTAELFDSLGRQITINKDGIQYDCFKFQTAIRIAV
jgi:hypothetical protein